MIKLTAPNGEPVWINPHCIERIVHVSNETLTTTRSDQIKTSRIDLSGEGMQIVQETPEQIINKK